MAASRLSPFKNWVADGFSDFCTNCQDKFTLLNRKHHCRSCGRLLCSPCASNWCLVPCDMMVVNPLRNDDSTVPQRCCAPCAKILVDQQSDLRELLSKSHTELKFERETALRYMNLPISFNLESDIKKATYTLYNFTSDNLMEGPDKIPKELISSAKGIAFFTILKAGFLFSGRIGTGLVISRLADGNWSAPSSVLLSGMGWGFQFGGELTDVILILTTDKAVETFTSSSQVSVGTELGVAAGPVGRSAGTDVHGSKKGAAAAFSYAHSKGLFAGISLEASVIVSRPDINRKFYGMEVEPAHLLSGKIPAPKCADPLYRALSEVLTKVEGENEKVGIGESLSNFLVGRVGGEQKSGNP